MSESEDPALRALEKALETQQKISNDALQRIAHMEPAPPPPPISTSGWTLEAFMAHWAALRQADDRRYAEVNVEKEKALKIKETADLAALQLAREIQTYKDEKANELREQIGSERGLYVTTDKYEDRIKGEQDARSAALLRVDEKFADYVKRWEQRQREVDQAISNQKSRADQKNAVLEAAAADAQKIAETQGREAIAAAQKLANEANAAAQELARKTNRNTAIVAIVVGVIVAIANGVGPF